MQNSGSLATRSVTGIDTGLKLLLLRKCCHASTLFAGAQFLMVVVDITGPWGQIPALSRIQANAHVKRTGLIRSGFCRVGSFRAAFAFWSLCGAFVDEIVVFGAFPFTGLFTAIHVFVDSLLNVRRILRCVVGCPHVTTQCCCKSFLYPSVGSLFGQVHVHICCCMDDGVLNYAFRRFIGWVYIGGKLQSLTATH